MYVLCIVHKIYNIIYILSSFSGEIREFESEIGEAEFLILRIYIWSAFTESKSYSTLINQKAPLSFQKNLLSHEGFVEFFQIFSGVNKKNIDT